MVLFGRRLAVALFCLLAPPLAAAPWPRVRSDLPPDPAVAWGTLPNGLRYAVRPNAEPAGRVSLRLLVAAGSAEEEADEQGLAHFIEHMAFRGTRTHPGDSLTTELQRLGIGFGPDAAAFTTVDHTIYHLDLPDNSAATLRAGLEIFREYAEEVSFDPALIDRERDVILNERDTRDTPNARTEQATLAMLWPDAPAVRRPPIGSTAQVRTFARAQFVRFYDAWYRPERMTVVIAGDLDPAVAVPLIAAALGPLKARARARPEVELAPATATLPTIRIFTDPGILGAHYLMLHPLQEPVNPDSHARRVEELRRRLALSILQHRANRVAQNDASGLIAPIAGVTTMVAGWSGVYFGATGIVNSWARYLAQLEQLRRAAVQYGFTAAELDLQRRAAQAGFEQAARSYPTWHSDWLATQLANSVIEGRVFATPAARQVDLAAELAAITPAECQAALRRAWEDTDPHLFISASPELTASFESVARVLEESRHVPVTPPPETPALVFAYPAAATPMAPTESQHLDDLDVWQARFANGVRLNFKATAFEANSVIASVRIGTGRLTEPRHRPGFELPASAMVNFGGLGRHSFEDLQDILSAHTLALSFTIDSDALQFSLRCAPDELGFSLRLLTAYLTDAGFRTEAMPKARAWMGDSFAALASSPAGPIEINAGRILSGGDDRFAAPTRATVDALKPEELRAWIEPQLRHGPIEVAIVGDTTWAAAAAAVGATLGPLAPRADRTPETTVEVLHVPTRPSKQVYLGTSEPSLKQVALAWYCPAAEVRTSHEERRCRLLAAVLAERLRVRLREELGAAYAFEADFAQEEGFPDLNFFSATTAVTPAHARRANELIRAEIARLCAGQLTEEEFQRIRQPFLQTREKDRRDNGYWCYTVLARAQLHPEHLAAARDRSADAASIRREDLTALAVKYFGPEHWFQFVAFPSTGRPALRPPLNLVAPQSVPRLFRAEGSH